jgi:hypothetical protein
MSSKTKYPAVSKATAVVYLLGKKSNPLDVVLHASEIIVRPNTRLQIVSFPFYNINVAINPP